MTSGQQDMQFNRMLVNSRRDIMKYEAKRNKPDVYNQFILKEKEALRKKLLSESKKKVNNNSYVYNNTSHLHGLMEYGHRELPTLKEMLEQRKKLEEAQPDIPTDKPELVNAFSDVMPLQNNEFGSTSVNDMVDDSVPSSVPDDASDPIIEGSGKDSCDKQYKIQVPNLQGSGMKILESIHDYPDVKRIDNESYIPKRNEREEQKKAVREKLNVEGAVYF